MRIWIDLANSPHVPLMEPVVAALEARGDEVVLSARDHAQTLPLAQRLWPDVAVIGQASPDGRAAKLASVLGRAKKLRTFRAGTAPQVALSHGSYAQVLACAGSRVPAVTMMDYEHQPANHISFRLASRIVVPEVFPSDALRRFGAHRRKVVRYPGFKEELYLGQTESPGRVSNELGLDPTRVIVVFRPPPDGALYHRVVNERFDDIYHRALAADGIQVVLLPRTRGQRDRYGEGALVPNQAVDGVALLALADVVVGGGGTMNRESALLGTPTYTVFAGRLAAVDQALIDRGVLFDLRDPGTDPAFVKKRQRPTHVANASALLSTLLSTLDSAAAGRT